MNIILTILGIGVAIFLIKLCFVAILNIIQYGMALFFLFGMPLGFAYLVGWISGDTAWTICKWAFYIGSGYGLINAILHPGEYFSNVFDELNDNSSSSSSSHSTHYREDRSSDAYDDGGYCKNCSRYEHGQYCTIGKRLMFDSTTGCKEMTYC